MKKENKLEFFILGTIAAFGALFVENAFNVLFSIQAANVLNRLTVPLVIYVVIEELLKLTILNKKKSTTKSHAFTFSNSFFLGLGFASTELFNRYLINSSLPANDLAPLFGISIIHITTSVVIGYLLYKKIPLWMTIFPPIFLHVLYNCLIIYEFDYFLIAIYLLFLVIVNFHVLFKLRNEVKLNLPNN